MESTDELLRRVLTGLLLANSVPSLPRGVPSFLSFRSGSHHFTASPGPSGLFFLRSLADLRVDGMVGPIPPRCLEFPL